MDEILDFVPPLLSQDQRHWSGFSAYRDHRAPYGRHEFRLVQPRHVVALHLSPLPIESADRLDGRALPTRTRDVRHKLNLIPAGAEWVSLTAPQGRSEYVAVFIPQSFTGILDDDLRIQTLIAGPALDVLIPSVQTVMSTIAEELRQPLYGDLLLDGASRALLRELARHAEGRPAAAKPGPRLNARQIRRLEETIDEAMDSSLSVAQLARAVGVSASVLTRATRNALGLAPHQLLLERRIARAQRLLRIGDLSLAEIAAACGFVDQSHFTTAFRKAAGLAPGQFRRLIR